MATLAGDRLQLDHRDSVTSQKVAKPGELKLQRVKVFCAQMAPAIRNLVEIFDKHVVRVALAVRPVRLAFFPLSFRDGLGRFDGMVVHGHVDGDAVLPLVTLLPPAHIDLQRSASVKANRTKRSSLPATKHWHLIIRSTHLRGHTIQNVLFLERGRALMLR